MSTDLWFQGDNQAILSHITALLLQCLLLIIGQRTAIWKLPSGVFSFSLTALEGLLPTTSTTLSDQSANKPNLKDHHIGFNSDHSTTDPFIAQLQKNLLISRRPGQARTLLLSTLLVFLLHHNLIDLCSVASFIPLVHYQYLSDQDSILTVASWINTFRKYIECLWVMKYIPKLTNRVWIIFLLNITILIDSVFNWLSIMQMYK